MYSSKVFSDLARSGISGEKIGFLAEKEKYQDNSHELPKRWKGKQLATNPPKKASGSATGYFGGLTYAPEPYVDKSGYLKDQPMDKRKLGFGSHAAKSRDEFMQHVRTEQYREQLRAEAKHGKARGNASDSKSEEHHITGKPPLGDTISGARLSKLQAAGVTVLREALEAPAGSVNLGSSLKTAHGYTLRNSQSVPSLARTGYDVSRDYRSPRSVYGLDRITDRYQERVRDKHNTHTRVFMHQYRA